MEAMFWALVRRAAGPLSGPRRPNARLVRRLERLAARWGIRVEEREELEPLGLSLGGRIWLRAGLAPADRARVLAHELAHERLQHPARAIPREVAEVEAGAAALLALASLGYRADGAAEEVRRWDPAGLLLLARRGWILEAAQALRDGLEGKAPSRQAPAPPPAGWPPWARAAWADLQARAGDWAFGAWVAVSAVGEAAALISPPAPEPPIRMGLYVPPAWRLPMPAIRAWASRAGFPLAVCTWWPAGWVLRRAIGFMPPSDPLIRI